MRKIGYTGFRKTTTSLLYLNTRNDRRWWIYILRFVFRSYPTFIGASKLPSAFCSLYSNSNFSKLKVTSFSEHLLGQYRASSSKKTFKNWAIGLQSSFWVAARQLEHNRRPDASRKRPECNPPRSGHKSARHRLRTSAGFLRPSLADFQLLSKEHSGIRKFVLHQRIGVFRENRPVEARTMHRIDHLWL